MVSGAAPTLTYTDGLRSRSERAEISIKSEIRSNSHDFVRLKISLISTINR